MGVGLLSRTVMPRAARSVSLTEREAWRRVTGARAASAAVVRGTATLGRRAHSRGPFKPQVGSVMGAPMPERAAALSGASPAAAAAGQPRADHPVPATALRAYWTPDGGAADDVPAPMPGKVAPSPAAPPAQGNSPAAASEYRNAPSAQQAHTPDGGALPTLPMRAGACLRCKRGSWLKMETLPPAGVWADSGTGRGVRSGRPGGAGGGTPPAQSYHP